MWAEQGALCNSVSGVWCPGVDPVLTLKETGQHIIPISLNVIQAKQIFLPKCTEAWSLTWINQWHIVLMKDLCSWSWFSLLSRRRYLQEKCWIIPLQELRKGILQLYIFTFIVFQYLTHVDRRKSRALSKANIKIESRRGSRAPSRGDIFSIENETPVKTHADRHEYSILDFPSYSDWFNSFPYFSQKKIRFCLMRLKI